MFSNFCDYSETLNNAIHFLCVPGWVFFVIGKLKTNWVKESVLLNSGFVSVIVQSGKHKYHNHENKGFIIVITAYINVGWNFILWPVKICSSGKWILLAVCKVNGMENIYRNN